MRRYCTIVIYIVFFSNSFAQDTQFSQFYSSPLYLAPSFAGVTDGSRVNINYRNQWPAIQKAYVSYAASYDHYFPHMKSGVGFLIMREQAGSGNLSTTNFGAMYSYNVQVDREWSFRPGIHFMYTQRSLNFDDLEFADGLEIGGFTDESVPNKFKADIDASVSVLSYNRKYWFGLTADHLLTPDRSLTGDTSLVPMKFSLFFGAKYDVRGRLRRRTNESLLPAILYKRQGNNNQLDIGLYWYKIPLVLGFWYRGIPVFKTESPHDAVVILAGYRISNLSIGYSYDLTISRLVGFTGGTHEISMMILFNQEQTVRRRRRPVPCPHF